MIISKSTGIPYSTYFTNSKHESFADAPSAKGGQTLDSGPTSFWKLRWHAA